MNRTAPGQRTSREKTGRNTPEAGKNSYLKGMSRAAGASRKAAVQLEPFGKPHYVLTAAGAAVFLIDWRSAHLHIRRRILMQA